MRKHPKNKKTRSPASLDNWIYGKNPIEEILRVGKRKIFEVITTPDFFDQDQNQKLVQLLRKNNVQVKTLSPKELKQRFDNQVHQNLAARVENYPYGEFSDFLKDLQERELVLALDGVTDPQNFATLCRSALAFGVRTILLPKDRSVEVTPIVCKSSSGAVEHLNIVRVVNLVRALEDLKKEGFWVYGTSLTERSQSLTESQPDARSVIVMGSEGKGLRPLVEKTCDHLLKIPMVAEFDSLNVAQAGSICLFWFRCQ